MQSSDEMPNNKLIIAAAGSGKTTFLVEQALAATDANVLITTYTENNKEEVRKRLFEKNGHIPKNITVQTWFSVLLQHGVRPYQGHLYEPDIKGMILVNGRSGVKYTNKNGTPVYYKEDTEFEQHYFSSERKIYSDKIAKFSCKCNEKSGNAIIGRMSKIYTHIFIDEVQDLGGWDLDIINTIAQSSINMVLVGDPRQRTYDTHDAQKNSNHTKDGITLFAYFKSLKGMDTSESLSQNYRCISSICELSNTLFSALPKAESGNKNTTEHDGVFLVKKADVAAYLAKYSPIQLRFDKRKKVDDSYPAMNFGASKGLAFERVLIYPTDKIKKWLRNHNSELPAESRSKLYVAITRARQSIAFVYDLKKNELIKDMIEYSA
jgi:superfamily I DNA/RNA helicase